MQKGVVDNNKLKKEVTMKLRKITWLIVLFLSISFSIQAHQWEVGFRVVNSNGELQSGKSITIYSINPSTRVLEYITSLSSLEADEAIEGCNAYVDMYEPNGLVHTPMTPIGSVQVIPLREEYIFVFEYSKYAKYVLKDGHSISAPLYDFAMVYNTSGNTIQDGGYDNSSWSYWQTGDWQDINIQFSSNKNSINSVLDSSPITLSTTILPKTYNKATFPHAIVISENQQSNFVWRNWIRNNVDVGSEGTLNLITEDLPNATNTVVAICAFKYNANITTNISGGGNVYINGTTYNCPTSGAFIYDDVPNTITAVNQSDNLFDYFFDHWEQNGSFYGSNSTIPLNNPSSNITLTAIYHARAIAPAITFGTQIGQPVLITWIDHPNTNVTQYKVYRRVFENGNWSAEQLLATVNRGVQSYTDSEYNLGVWKQDQLLEYGLTAYYSVNDNWSTGGANTRVYCTPGAKYAADNLKQLSMVNELPTDYSINSYPNPFNPTTTIKYQLPQDGMVTIKVYDVLGKEVATLVNEQKSAGYYKVDYDASKLTSGVYICSIQSNSFSKSIKLLLTK
jgi:hypothetical protein